MRKEQFQYGGQAVINGVMMRGKTHTAIAVRLANNDIKITNFENTKITKSVFREVPFIRGILIMIETVLLGVKATIYSAQVTSQEESQQEISSGILWSTVLISVFLGIVIFFVIPLLITNTFIQPVLKSAILSNISEGIIRILFFILYLRIISFVKDVKLVFQYHGAEHKVINAWEANDSMNIDTIKKYGIVHFRCGTGFIFFVLIIAILVFSILGELPLWVAIITRIFLLPLIAGISYEIIKLASINKNKKISIILMFPGLALQALTTRIPEDGQIEVALAAFQRVLSLDNETSAF